MKFSSSPIDVTKIAGDYDLFIGQLCVYSSSHMMDFMPLQMNEFYFHLSTVGSSFAAFTSYFSFRKP